MATNIQAREWIEVVAARLQQRWPTVDPVRLDDVAGDLWADERLRALAPEQAADDWLRPVMTKGTSAKERNN